MQTNSDFKPQILDPRNDSDSSKLTELMKTAMVVDDYKNQLEELDEITAHDKKGPKEPPKDVWVYYPWSGHIVHTLSNPHFKYIRTSRNLNIITVDEMGDFNKTIGIAGLNVGNPAALCMVLEGVLTAAKYADNDILALSNLNRFRARCADLGLNKAVLSARQSYEIDPFLDIQVLDHGIVAGEEEEFLTSPKIDILIEEMDNLPLKVSIREAAKKYKVPVVMVTGNGENVIVDVERYDLDPNTKILNGYLAPEIIETIKSPGFNSLPKKAKVLLARDFMGENHLVPRLRLSFEEVTETLAGIPQLAESSFLRGAAVCYVSRRILNEQEMPSGRYYLEMDKITHTGGKYDSAQ